MPGKARRRKRRQHNNNSRSSVSSSDPHQAKRRLIEACLRSNPVDVPELRRLALAEGGLLCDELRYKVWPKLLAVNVYKASDFRAKVRENKDTDQIQRDIDRSMWHFTVHKTLSDGERQTKREALSAIINAIVCEHPSLNYYQGYHDVVTVFLIVVGEQRAYQLVEQSSLHFFRECMRPDFQQVTTALQLIMPLFELEDPEFYQYLCKSEVEPFFALPWLITWFAHHLADLRVVARLYDAFLSAHPLFSLYFCAAVALSRRDVLLTEVECEFAMVHTQLTKLPEDMPMKVERFLREAAQMFARHPPEALARRAKPRLSFPKACAWLDWDWVPATQQPDSALWAEARGKKRPRRKRVRNRGGGSHGGGDSGSSANDRGDNDNSKRKRHASGAGRGKQVAFWATSVLAAATLVTSLSWYAAELSGGAAAASGGAAYS
eukprot:g17.t1